MELLLASAIGVLIGGGLYMLLRARTFSVILGFTALSYGVNLFLFSSGGIELNQPPLIQPNEVVYTDPLPQALVLTAIVIGFAMTALLAVMAICARHTAHSDHVDADGGEDS